MERLTCTCGHVSFTVSLNGLQCYKCGKNYESVLKKAKEKYEKADNNSTCPKCGGYTDNYYKGVPNECSVCNGNCDASIWDTY